MLKRVALSIKIMYRDATVFAFLKTVFMLISALSVPVLVYTTEEMIASLVNIGNSTFSPHDTLLGVGIFVLINFWLIIQVHINNVIQIKTQICLKKKLLPIIAQKASSIDYCHFENSADRDVLHRMEDSPHDLVLSIFDTTLSLIRDAISILGIAFLFARISFGFFLIFLFVLLPVLWCDYRSTIIVHRMHREQSYTERELGYYDGLLSNKYALHELKIMNGIRFIQKVWNDKAAVVLCEHMKATLKSQVLMLSSTLLLLIFSGSVMGLLLYKVIGGVVSIGMFVSLVNAIQSIYSISYSLSDSITSLSRRSYQMEYIEKFFSMTDSLCGTKEIPTNKGSIVFDHVSFTYPNSAKKALDNLTFTINTGEKLCIVGRNGAGKSTIIKLLSGLYRPNSGSIKFNGIDIADISAESMKSIRSVVFQDYFKYYSKIRENVSYGNLKQLQNNSEIYNALLRAQAADFVSTLPHELDTHLGDIEDTGVDLSVGQWQKIAIARACFLQSSIIVLDEPTASLDPIAESLMYHTFSEALSNCGYIFISHRLASAKLADRILVIEDGRIIEDGNHDELMKQQGLYSKMFQEQSAWYMITEEE